MRLTFVVIAGLLIVGCRPSTGATAILERATYLQVYCDLVQESLRSKNSGADPKTASSNAERIFQKHAVTRAQFDSTTNWYNADVRRWKGFYDDAAKELELRELRPPTPPLEPGATAPLP
jgi:hypothetical protein